MKCGFLGLMVMCWVGLQSYAQDPDFWQFEGLDPLTQVDVRSGLAAGKGVSPFGQHLLFPRRYHLVQRLCHAL